MSPIGFWFTGRIACKPYFLVVRVYIHMYTHKHQHKHLHKRKWKFVYVHIHMYISMHKCMYRYIHMYTHVYRYGPTKVLALGLTKPPHTLTRDALVARVLAPLTAPASGWASALREDPVARRRHVGCLERVCVCESDVCIYIYVCT